MKKDIKSISKINANNFKSKLIAFIILSIVSFFWLLPLFYMLGMSFKTDVDIGMNPNRIFPTPGNWTLEHYSGFFKLKGSRIDDLPIWMINSIVICFFTVVLTIIVDTLAAYAFVFLRFRGRKLLFTMIVFSMTIPGVISMTPSFSIYATLGNAINGLSADKVYNYMWLIMPATTSVFNLYLMKNFFDSIPGEIVESGRIDGASDFRIFRSIILPLARSTILLVALFSFSGSWNDLLWPSLILSGKDSTFYTITVALTGYTSGDSWAMKGLAMSTSVFALIPVLIVFLITQNRMIDGLASTGVKR